MPQKNYWLMKTEPTTFSIDDLARQKVSTWEGVRNFQARNFLRDDFKLGDEALIYHSSAKPMGIAGLGRVCKTGYPDPTAWDPNSEYYDPRSTPEKPVWYMVDVEFVAKFEPLITLSEMHDIPELKGMMVLRRGARLSIQPVSKEHFDVIRTIGLKRRPGRASPK